MQNKAHGMVAGLFAFIASKMFKKRRYDRLRGRASDDDISACPSSDFRSVIMAANKPTQQRSDAQPVYRELKTNANHCKENCFGNSVAKGGRRISLVQLVSTSFAEPRETKSSITCQIHGLSTWWP